MFSTLEVSMETYASMNTERPLWSTFYPALLGDIERISPEISASEEMCILRHAEKAYGEDLYLTVLPSMGKQLDKALAASFSINIGYEAYGSMWPTLATSEGFPRFLTPFWKKLFASYGGLKGIIYPRFDIRDSEEVSLGYEVFCLRQFLLAFSKVTDVEPKVSCDDEVNSFIDRVTKARKVSLLGRNDVLSNARRLLREVLCDTEQLGAPAEESDLHPSLEAWIATPFGCHGPGAVAEGEKGQQKWDFDAIPGIDGEIYSYFPRDFHDALQCASDPRLANAIENSNVLVSRCSRLAIVPKDFRGHRLICIEPKELQFAQQGLMRVIYKITHSHWLTRRSINFNNQEHSQRLARNLSFATIDLKDASDCISLEIARLLLPRRFFKLITKYRSSHVEINGEIHRLRCLATMGSGLCFPLETLIFWAISLGAMLAHDGIAAGAAGFLTWASRYRLRVFGDDIIVPASQAGHVIEALENFGLVVNQGKTCIDTLSREACGAWYYNQDDVRILRFKTSRTIRPESWLGLLSQLAEMRDMGFKQTFQAIRQAVVDPMPPNASKRWQRRVGSALHTSFYRYNVVLQRLEFWMPVDVSLQRALPLQGVDGLYAHFTSQATNSLRLEDPREVEWRWVPIVPVMGI